MRLMLRITIESHRVNDPAVEWVMNALQFRQVPFVRKVLKEREGVVTVQIIKKEAANAEDEK